MVDPTEREKQAMQSCLRPMGEIVTEQGVNFASYTKEQALTLIEVVVTAYQKAMVEYAGS